VSYLGCPKETRQQKGAKGRKEGVEFSENLEPLLPICLCLHRKKCKQGEQGTGQQEQSSNLSIISRKRAGRKRSGRIEEGGEMLGDGKPIAPVVPVLPKRNGTSDRRARKDKIAQLSLDKVRLFERKKGKKKKKRTKETRPSSEERPADGQTRPRRRCSSTCFDVHKINKEKRWPLTT